MFPLLNDFLMQGYLACLNLGLVDVEERKKIAEEQKGKSD